MSKNRNQESAARKQACRLALVAGAFLFSLLAAELAVRVLGVDCPICDTGIVPHPLWHHWHRANYDLDYQVVNEGYSQHVHFNGHGMRDSRSIALTKPAGVFRVAALGDSFVEALQVTEQEGVCRELERLLSKQWSRVEALNFGCSGFSSITEHSILGNYVCQFEPDLVICFHHFSDMTEDWMLEPQSCWGAERQSIARSFFRHSQLYRLAAGFAQRVHRHRAPPPDASLQSSFDAVLHDPYMPADFEAWDHSLDRVRQMKSWCDIRGLPFLVVVIPIGTQIEPVSLRFAARMGFRYLADGNRLENDNYQRHVCDYCGKWGIPCLNLRPDFRVANPTGRPWLYLPRDQHWTASGHALAARCVAAELIHRFPLDAGKRKPLNQRDGKNQIAERCDGAGPHR